MKKNVVLNFMSNHVVEQYDLLSRISNIHFHIIQLLVCMEDVVENHCGLVFVPRQEGESSVCTSVIIDSFFNCEVMILSYVFLKSQNQIWADIVFW